ncbi:MAG: hypothetical protein K0Q73_5208 [Paenibacillus sp.]|jgi:hypothetical protein|nr:hypothetical protein [Paenibacillus sp.]
MGLKIEKVNWNVGEQQGCFYLINRKVQVARGVWKSWMFGTSRGEKYGKVTLYLFNWVIGLHMRPESIERQFQMLGDHSIDQMFSQGAAPVGRPEADTIHRPREGTVMHSIANIHILTKNTVDGRIRFSKEYDDETFFELVERRLGGCLPMDWKVIHIEKSEFMGSDSKRMKLIAEIPVAVSPSGSILNPEEIITLAEEPGSSLKAAGFEWNGKSDGGSWNSERRKRVDRHPIGRKNIWKIRFS